MCCFPAVSAVVISIHSLRMEGDMDGKTSLVTHRLFQSTPSAWRETNIAMDEAEVPQDFNPLPPHGGRLSSLSCVASWIRISIHSLRMEGDAHFGFKISSNLIFQSTPSAWRETLILSTLSTIHNYFNPLPPHGGRLVVHLCDAVSTVISIHSLRMEGDTQHLIDKQDKLNHFNPLPPHGGRLPRFHNPQTIACISIHSLRMEGDGFFLRSCFHLSFHFNPLPPHGGRRAVIRVWTGDGAFQSTPSAWRETLSDMHK